MDLELAKNAATNGRLITVGIGAAALVWGVPAALLLVLVALALAYVSDMLRIMGWSALTPAASIGSIGFTIVSFVVLTYGVMP